MLVSIYFFSLKIIGSQTPLVKQIQLSYTTCGMIHKYTNQNLIYIGRVINLTSNLENETGNLPWQ